MSVADDLEAVSCDEALIDVTTKVHEMPPSNDPKYDSARAFAEILRLRIKRTTGCEGKF